MSAAHKPRVAVWGLGRHGRLKILPALAQCEDVVLQGVTTRDQAVAAKEAMTHGCKAWPDPESMLADPEVDAIYVCTPIGLHHEQGMRVLAAGKHLWCEKSLTESYQHTAELLAASRAHDLSVCEGFMYVYHPQFRRLAELVASGELGSVVTLSCRFGLPHLDPSGFRYSAALGGGALLDLGCYPLSAALRLIGGVPTVVSHELRSADRYGSYDVDIDGMAVLQFPSGARAFLDWGLGRAYRNDIEVWGEKGSVFTNRIFSKAPDYEATLIVRNGRGDMRREQLAGANHFVAMFSEFARSCSDAGVRERLRDEVERQGEHLARLRG